MLLIFLMCDSRPRVVLRIKMKGLNAVYLRDFQRKFTHGNYTYGASFNIIYSSVNQHNAIWPRTIGSRYPHVRS